MPLTLVKETGDGLDNANCYASAADGDSYHEAHYYASAWVALSTANKEKALVMATRLIDTHFKFEGFKRLSTQALQWPRREVRNEDVQNYVIPGLLTLRGPYLDETTVPTVVLQAACELAREIVKTDRTDDPDGEGIRVSRIEGGLTLEFDKNDRPPVVTQLVQTMLSKFGAYLGGKSNRSVKIVRT